MRVSVLIPSRGRPRKLKEAIDSIIQTASEPSQVEIIVRLDEDDTDTLSQLDGIKAKLIVGERGEGYLDAHVFWNEMAFVATGHWISAFNDDARMLEPGWDVHLDSYKDPICLVIPQDNTYDNRVVMWHDRDGQSHSSTAGERIVVFPIFPRKIYDKLGHVTLFPGIDTWMYHMMMRPKLFPIYYTSAIRILHMRPDLPGFEDQMDDAWKESCAAEKQLNVEFDVDSFYAWRDLVAADVRRLSED